MSVILITVDTLRPDRMGVYGAKRDTTPNLERWTAGALRFDRAYTAGAWTSLALSSLFRGVYPRRLSWTWVYETNKFRPVTRPFQGQLRKGEKARKVFGSPIHDPRLTLGHYLRRRGMATVAVVDDGHSMFLEPELGIAGVDAFSHYFLADQLP